MKINTTEIEEWIAHDPQEETRAELSSLLARAKDGDTAAKDSLADRFRGPLQFGTAGLRGKMGAGPFRMNRAVVRRAAAGLTAWLKEKIGSDALVVIGYDARYNSADFAKDTAAIVTAAGLRAKIMPRTLPTPLLAFAVRHLHADAGVMVTASHNPAQDNGYKVYVGNRAVDADGNGVQIIPPTDGEIAAKIAAAPHADEIPLAESGWEEIEETVIETYIRNTVEKLGRTGARDLKIVYTAMHGVGYETMMKIFAGAGFTDVTGVPEQIAPDPDFPTVAFPNPEEAGALDLAIALAEKENADIVIASDPDADRCSAAVPTAEGWRQLSGDEIGSVLGEIAARRNAGKGREATLASSVVSSRLLEQIARHHGLHYQATLTGFKWIARAPKIIYGYEEAIGFCVNPADVKDKDGISAGLALAVEAARLKAEGRSMTDALDDLYRRHGVYLSGPVTVRVEDLSIIPATMAKLRTCPPTVLAGSKVVRFEDLSKGSAKLPPTDAVKIVTEANDRVIIRPSGTEPKVKCYLEVIVPLKPEDEGGLRAAKTEAAKRLSLFKQDMHEALKL